MSVQIKEFTFGKDRVPRDINIFYKGLGFGSTTTIDRSQIIDVSVVQLADNRIKYLVTYEDTTPPEVISTIPTQGAVGVDTGTDVQIIFSEDIDGTSVVEDTTIKLTEDGSPVSLSGKVTVLSNVVTIDGSVISSADKTYIVTLTTGIKDLSGNNLANPFTLAFNTGVITTLIDSGTITVTGGLSYAVSFTSGFTSAPRIALTWESDTDSVKHIGTRVTSLTSSGFTAVVDEEDWSAFESEVNTELDSLKSAVNTEVDAQINALEPEINSSVDTVISSVETVIDTQDDNIATDIDTSHGQGPTSRSTSAVGNVASAATSLTPNTAVANTPSTLFPDAGEPSTGTPKLHWIAVGS